MSGSLRVPIALCRPAPFDALPISMSLLARAVKLLQPHLGGAKRETWLTLAFAEQRAIADAIDRTGAAADFTVRCVRYLLDRGCVGTRHALSLLLEVVSTGVDSEVQGDFRALIDELDHQCAASGATARPVDARPGDASGSQFAATKVAARPPFPTAGQPAGDPAIDFFVSYTGKDQAWAEWIAWQIEAAGYQTTIQSWDIAAGNNFVLAMHTAASRARRTIAVLSPDYLVARYTQPEWAAAFADDPTGASGKLLPVRVRECQPDGMLRAIVYVDLVGCEEDTARQRLLTHIRGERLNPSRPPGYPGKAAAGRGEAPLFPSVLQRYREEVLAAGQPPEITSDRLQEILRHSPRDLDEYRLLRIAEWSQPRYALDRRFTRLTLLLDQGPEAQGARWQAGSQSFTELREVLAATPDSPALVLLGPPGCGKSTLLRRLELDLALDALRAGDASRAARSMFVPLSRHRPPQAGQPPPLPREWLAQEWERRHPQLPPFGDLLASGRLVLLLDAVNELPHADAGDYRQRAAQWRDFLGELPAGTRAIFSCRSLDYSASLSSAELAVPHVRIETLSDSQVEDFLRLYRPERASELWSQLRGSDQLDLFRSPYYLKLLLAQEGDAPLQGRATLFTAFVRQCLRREIDTPTTRSFAPAPCSPPAITSAACSMTGGSRPNCLRAARCCRHSAASPTPCRHAGAGGKRARVPYDDALDLHGAPADELMHAGVALQVVEVQWDDVLYVHQLLQEYFAARVVAAEAQPALAASAWRADEIVPRLAETLATRADSDPLPEAPATGWEETFVLASAMAADPEKFVTDLIAVNLPLAGRCAAQPEVRLLPSLRERLQKALVERSRDPAADLRARIAAARALGQLGDPRFARRRGPFGDYLLPPVVEIAGGDYRIGSDEGLYQDEAPVHELKLAPFAVGRFPVTNAEWRRFVAAGGYADERWWQGEAAKRWQRGEGTDKGPKEQWRRNRRFVCANPGLAATLLREGRISSRQIEFWEEIRQMSDDDFEQKLRTRYAGGRQSEPALWNDPAFNDATQPVVGVCWYEVRAYCAWLSAQTGQDWRLPSEAEWEAAARGRAGHRYAWGDEFDAARCNVFETHVRRTTPVGVFPGGDTPEGLSEITGNVWEWTSSAYETYAYRADRRREDTDRADARRVVRGGSWNSYRVVARGACRDGGDPGARSDDVGLRLVCVSSILKR